MLLKLHTFFDLIADLVTGCTDLLEILFNKFVRQTFEAFDIVQPHPRLVKYLLINIGRNNLDF